MMAKCRYETQSSKRCLGTKEVDPCKGHDKCKDFKVVEEFRPKNKLKTPFATIVAGGDAHKPCFGILYFDPSDKKLHHGFGSYEFANVKKWYEEEFEVIFDGCCPICGTKTDGEK